MLPEKGHLMAALFLFQKRSEKYERYYIFHGKWRE